MESTLDMPEETDNSSFEDDLVVHVTGKDILALMDRNKELTEKCEASDKEIANLQKSLFSLVLQSKTTLTKLELLREMVTKQSSLGTPDFPLLLSSIDSILSTPSLIPQISLMDLESDKEEIQSISSLEVNSCPQELGDTFLDLVDNSTKLEVSINDLEKAVDENGSIIDSLSGLQIPAITDLRRTLSVLYHNNILLTSIIDSNNQHEQAMLSLLNQKEEMICSLQNELVDTQATISKLQQDALLNRETQENHREETSIPEETQENHREETPIPEETQEVEKKETDTKSAASELMQLQQELEEVRSQLATEKQRSEKLEKQVLELRVGVQVSTPAGDFSTANPSAIIACIQGLLSRVNLAEASMEIAERKVQRILLEQKENCSSSSTEGNHLQAEVCHLQEAIKKLKQNEAMYKKNIFDLQSQLKARKQQLLDARSLIQLLKDQKEFVH